MQLSEQEIVRRESLQKLRALGINPYPAAQFKTSATIKQIVENYSNFEDKEVVLAGRMMSRRIMGKASFAELKDGSGRMQIYINRDEIYKNLTLKKRIKYLKLKEKISESIFNAQDVRTILEVKKSASFDYIKSWLNANLIEKIKKNQYKFIHDEIIYNIIFKKLMDIGDIIGIKGVVFKTKVGEVSVRVNQLTMLSKALKPLPVVKTDSDGNVHDALTDPELRYRQRYVDLIVNDHVKETFIKRTKITNAMRQFFNERDYIEVETPILQPIPGGATASPFVTHHNALNIPLYLRIANELYLKRLIVGGFDAVYEFSKDFRNEGMDKTHNPEFTVMELYVAYKDYHWMMNMTEQLLEKIAIESNQSSTVIFGEHQIHFKAPYARVPILEAIKIHTGFDLNSMNQTQLIEVCKKLDIEADESMGIGKLIDEIFGEKCEHHYIQPTFITDYPKEMSPLCKEHRDNPRLTERFELLVAGKELANAYSELNDPIDQKERFEEQLRLSEKGDDEAMFIDQDFVRALEYGMPPTSGIGIGIDRLTMFMTNNSSIQEVLFFPQMRPEKKQVTLTNEEKIVFDILKNNSPILLHELKEKSALSNKKWDKTIKGLTKNKLAKVNKNDDGLFVEMM